MSVTLPDFKRISETIKHEHFNTGVPLEYLISTALLEMFSKGRSLGKREGYEEGLTTGWSDQMDKEYKSKEGGNSSRIVRHTGQRSD